MLHHETIKMQWRKKTGKIQGILIVGKSATGGDAPLNKKKKT